MSTTSDPGPATVQSRRRYVPRPQPSAWGRLPFTVRYVIPALLLLSVAFLGYRWWNDSRVQLRFAFPDGAVPDLQLTFYPDEYPYVGPSPPPITGEATVKAGETLTVGWDRVPGRGVVRYAGAGVGTGFTHVELGRADPLIVLSAAASLPGRVLCDEGGAPVADARVIAMGGGSRGVPLAETRTDAEGHFELQGFDGSQFTIGVRVLKPGFAILDEETRLDTGYALPNLRLQTTKPIAGRVLLAPGMTPEGLLLIVRGVPGIQATIAADGSFVLDHVPTGTFLRLLLHGLPAAFTHPRVRAEAGDLQVVVAIARAATVRGKVIDGLSNVFLGNALVYHENGPNGLVVTNADANGNFLLSGLPPGESVVTAQVPIHGAPREAAQHRSGERRVTVVEGAELTDVMIRIE